MKEERKNLISKESTLTHINDKGEIHMVDVVEKKTTHRIAIAQSYVVLGQKSYQKIQDQGIKKGDIFSTIRLAGIMAAKKTSDLIPLCHPIFLSHISIDISVLDRTHVKITAKAETKGVTGVEMEAMTAASVAALTLYDMLKSVDRGIFIQSIKLLHKSGGKSGVWNLKENDQNNS